MKWSNAVKQPGALARARAVVLSGWQGQGQGRMGRRDGGSREDSEDDDADWAVGAAVKDGKDHSGIQGPGRLLSKVKKELVQPGGHLPVVRSFIVEPTISAFLTLPRLSLAGGRACCGLSFSSALAKGAQAAGGFHFLAMASGTLGQCPPPPNPGTNPRRQGSKGSLSRQPLRRAGQLEPLTRCGFVPRSRSRVRRTREQEQEHKEYLLVYQTEGAPGAPEPGSGEAGSNVSTQQHPTLAVAVPVAVALA
ncbi:hypothetical protein CSOJ01_00318 [Colletotrichum sojae]|uniref:Uncharacterized protein n=1 Tax=Colletotrichum sojae TaxID=2175907 RepID=A0A8H6N5N6_9PEZI|nr:hypothetical protein CSOJ01_00318 [Colletotrichum sojae]